MREGGVVGFFYSGTLYSELGEEEVHQTIPCREQTPEQVRRLNRLVAIPASQVDSSLESLLRLDRILIYIHILFYYV